MSIGIVVAGAGGRMGKTLVGMIAQNGDLALCGALEVRGHPDLGADAGLLAGARALNVVLTNDALPLIAGADAIVDFTAPKYRSSSPRWPRRRASPM